MAIMNFFTVKDVTYLFRTDLPLQTSYTGIVAPGVFSPKGMCFTLTGNIYPKIIEWGVRTVNFILVGNKEAFFFL